MDKIRTIKLCGKEWKVTVQRGHYSCGRAALFLRLGTGENAGELLAKCSINLPDLACPEGEIWVKNYSENEGMLDWLIAEGLIERESEAVATLPFGNVISRHKLAAEKKMTGPLDSCSNHKAKEQS